jgi:UDP-N-acetylglucosamine--N-acetylmuramyl-(pentapeptide) pyrophosphoryl-undecaprenol N-acetylglucosamine transferase
VTACGKPCIFIPFPHAVDDHQRRNADAILNQGAGFMLTERELTAEGLATMILELMDQPQVLERTAAAARGMARLDAAKTIVDRIVASI